MRIVHNNAMTEKRMKKNKKEMATLFQSSRSSSASTCSSSSSIAPFDSVSSLAFSSDYAYHPCLHSLFISTSSLHDSPHLYRKLFPLLYDAILWQACTVIVTLWNLSRKENASTSTFPFQDRPHLDSLHRFHLTPPSHPLMVGVSERSVSCETCAAWCQQCHDRWLAATVPSEISAVATVFISSPAFTAAKSLFFLSPSVCATVLREVLTVQETSIAEQVVRAALQKLPLPVVLTALHLLKGCQRLLLWFFLRHPCGSPWTSMSASSPLSSEAWKRSSTPLSSSSSSSSTLECSLSSHVGVVQHLTAAHTEWCHAMALGITRWILESQKNGEIHSEHPTLVSQERWLTTALCMQCCASLASSFPLSSSVALSRASPSASSAAWRSQGNAKEPFPLSSGTEVPPDAPPPHPPSFLFPPSPGVPSLVHVAPLLSLVAPVFASEEAHGERWDDALSSSSTETHSWCHASLPEWIVTALQEHHAVMWSQWHRRQGCWIQWRRRKGMTLLHRLVQQMAEEKEHEGKEDTEGEFFRCMPKSASPHSTTRGVTPIDSLELSIAPLVSGCISPASPLESCGVPSVGEAVGSALPSSSVAVCSASRRPSAVPERSSSTPISLSLEKSPPSLRTPSPTVVHSVSLSRLDVTEGHDVMAIPSKDILHHRSRSLQRQRKKAASHQRKHEAVKKQQQKPHKSALLESATPPRKKACTHERSDTPTNTHDHSATPSPRVHSVRKESRCLPSCTRLVPPEEQERNDTHAPMTFHETDASEAARTRVVRPPPSPLRSTRQVDHPEWSSTVENDGPLVGAHQAMPFSSQVAADPVRFTDWTSVHEAVHHYAQSIQHVQHLQLQQEYFRRWVLWSEEMQRRHAGMWRAAATHHRHQRVQQVLSFWSAQRWERQVKRRKEVAMVHHWRQTRAQQRCAVVFSRWRAMQQVHYWIREHTLLPLFQRWQRMVRWKAWQISHVPHPHGSLCAPFRVLPAPGILSQAPSSHSISGCSPTPPPAQATTGLLPSTASSWSLHRTPLPFPSSATPLDTLFRFWRARLWERVADRHYHATLLARMACVFTRRGRDSAHLQQYRLHAAHHTRHRYWTRWANAFRLRCGLHAAHVLHLHVQRRAVWSIWQCRQATRRLAKQREEALVWAAVCRGCPRTTALSSPLTRSHDSPSLAPLTPYARLTLQRCWRVWCTRMAETRKVACIRRRVLTRCVRRWRRRQRLAHQRVVQHEANAWDFCFQRAVRRCWHRWTGKWQQRRQQRQEHLWQTDQVLAEKLDAFATVTHSFFVWRCQQLRRAKQRGRRWERKATAEAPQRMWSEHHREQDDRRPAASLSCRSGSQEAIAAEKCTLFALLRWKQEQLERAAAEETDAGDGEGALESASVWPCGQTPPSSLSRPHGLHDRSPRATPLVLRPSSLASAPLLASHSLQSRTLFRRSQLASYCTSLRPSFFSPPLPSAPPLSSSAPSLLSLVPERTVEGLPSAAEKDFFPASSRTFASPVTRSSFFPPSLTRTRPHTPVVHPVTEVQYEPGSAVELSCSPKHHHNRLDARMEEKHSSERMEHDREDGTPIRSLVDLVQSPPPSSSRRTTSVSLSPSLKVALFVS